MAAWLMINQNQAELKAQGSKYEIGIKPNAIKKIIPEFNRSFETQP
jgi:hypothetical protein